MRDAPTYTFAFLGDIVGSPGRHAAAAAVKSLRARGVEIIIANAENARSGSGLSSDNYHELKKAGLTALTMGDHVFADPRIVPLLENPDSRICRPANLSAAAPGKTFLRLAPAGAPPLYVFTVLGRIFMSLHADNPFDAIDRIMGQIPEPDALAVVEIHGEATSEKQAVAWHCLERWTEPAKPRIVAVVGSHTHVRTDDARILESKLAAITDLGMTGAHRGVIGRAAHATLRSMRIQDARPRELARRDVRASGAMITVDYSAGEAVAIEPLDLASP